MKRPMTAEEVYVQANRLFPDDGDLAAFNLIYEIRNGLMIPMGTDDEPDGEAKLVGVIGYLDLGEEYWIMQTIGQPADADALLRTMEARILELPENEEPDAEPVEISREFPTAVAAMGAWRTPDGATRLVAYRHPDLREGDAYDALKGVIAEAEAKRAGAAAPSKIHVEN